MSSQSTKEEKVKFDRNIPGKMCWAIHRKKSLCESKDYYKSIKINSAFNSNYIKYQSANFVKMIHTNNQKCIDCLKPRSNKNDCECKKYGCDYFYVPNY